MHTIAYQCPCCGSPLSYDGASGKLQCASCGNAYEPEVMESMTLAPSANGVEFDLPSASLNASEASEMQAYTCKNCGAELMAEDTTTATQCPYCGSPTILPEQIQGGVRPEKVIPFTVTKEQAQKQFEEYFKGKRLLPNIFINSRNRIAEMRKLYVPYWLFDCDADADIVYDAEKTHTERSGEWEIKRTEHFVARRSGSLGFDGVPVDGSVKLDDKITESLEPYDFSSAVAFQPAVLAGAMADCADVDAQACESRAVERVENSIESAMRDTVTGYSSVRVRSKNISSRGGKANPVLMPVWLITTEKEGKTYTFAINGQTGKLTCDVPTDKGKAFTWGAGIFAGVFGLGALALWLMESLESGSLVIAGVLALIVALAVVWSMIAKLKQAAPQSAASEYVRDGSFDLCVQYDYFLYETTERRKIETKKENN